MLAIFRALLSTWIAKILFAVLVLAFGLWGVADVVRNIGTSSTALATVGNRRIEPMEAQEAYRRQLAEIARQSGRTDLPPELRQQVALQVVQQLMTQAALQEKVSELGLVVPDEAVRKAVYEIPGFQGPNHQFDRTVMQNALRNNGLTEPRFLELVRADLGLRQLMDVARAGTAVPNELARQAYAFQSERRVADAVAFRLDDAPPQAAPTNVQVERWWANHPERYSTPEYRRVKAVVLSAETVASDVPVSEDDLKAAWEQRKSEYLTPEKRSVQIIITSDAEKAAALSAQWKSGADWTAMQAASEKAGATAVELADATRAEFPTTELAQAVFAAPEGVVLPPIATPLGTDILRVSKITPAGQATFESAKDALRKRLVGEKAGDAIYERANRIDNELAGGTTLDNLPGDSGVSAVTGTLDAQGQTPAGDPAPIPGGPEVRQALVQAAFAAKVGDAPKLTQAPGAPGAAPSFFAVVVEEITAPAQRPLDKVAEQVRADWARDQQRRAQEERAAKLLAAVQGGASLSAAAAETGATAKRLPPVPRGVETQGVPGELARVLFSLKRGEATMVETADGFMVAVLADQQSTDPMKDPAGYARTREALNAQLGEDIEQTLAVAIRSRAGGTYNAALVTRLAGSGE